MDAPAGVYEAGHIKRKRATKAEVEERRDSLFEIVEAMKPMTVRQVFYQASVRGIVEKSEAGYNKVQIDLVQMRRAGEMPYGWLADSTRWQRKPRTFNSVYIEKHLPPDQLKILRVAEESERTLIRQFVDGLGGAPSTSPPKPPKPKPPKPKPPAALDDDGGAP
jgi:hypothetical protein